MLHCKLLRSPLPHALIESIDVAARRRASRRASRPDREGLPDRVRHPAGDAGRIPARARARPLRRRPGRGGDREGRADRVRGARPDRREVHAARDDRHARGGARPTPSRASTTTASGATSTACRRSSSATSRRRSPGPTTSSRTSSSSRATRISRSSSTPRSRRWTPTASSRCGRAPRCRTTSTGCSRACCASPRRTCASIAAPNGGGFGGKCDLCNHEAVVAKAALMLGRPVKICLTREEVFYMHRGRHPVLMRFRTGVTKDGKLDRDAPADAGRRRRLRVVRRREHLLHRRAADGDLRAAALPLRGVPRLHQQAAVRPQARPRHAAAALRPGGAARQDRREARTRSGRAAAQHRREAELAHRELAAASARSGSPSASARWSSSRTGRREAPQAARRPRPRDRVRLVSLRRRACRSTGTRCRSRACSSSSTAAAKSPCSAARPRSGRARTTCSPRSSPRCSASTRSTCAS